MDQMCWIKDVLESRCTLNALKAFNHYMMWVCLCKKVVKNVEGRVEGRGGEREEEKAEEDCDAVLRLSIFLGMTGLSGTDLLCPLQRKTLFIRSFKWLLIIARQLYTKLALKISLLLSFRKKIFSPKIGMMSPPVCSGSEVLPAEIRQPPPGSGWTSATCQHAAGGWPGWHPRVLPWKCGRWPDVTSSSSTDCAELPTLPALFRGRLGPSPS